MSRISSSSIPADTEADFWLFLHFVELEFDQEGSELFFPEIITSLFQVSVRPNPKRLES